MGRYHPVVLFDHSSRVHYIQGDVRTLGQIYYWGQAPLVTSESNYMLRQGMLAIALLLALGASDALARTWNSANGAFKIEAELIEKRADGTVILKRADGTNIETKAEKLSKADQDYIRQWTPGGDAAKAEPAQGGEAPKAQDVPEKPGSALNPEAAAAIGKIKSAEVKAAVQAYEETEKKLSAAQAAKQKDYREKLAGMLEEALKEATAAGNLDDALAIRNAVKALRSGEGPPVGTRGAAGEAAKEHRGVKGRIFANCDDEFIMCVNGKEVLRSDNSRQIGMGDYAFSKGDVITVRVSDIGGTRGFCCAIKLERGKPIVSSDKWSAYQPKSEKKWSDHKGATAVQMAQLGNSEGAYKNVANAAGVANPAVIWGSANPSYLMYVVP